MQVILNSASKNNKKLKLSSNTVNSLKTHKKTLKKISQLSNSNNSKQHQQESKSSPLSNLNKSVNLLKPKNYIQITSKHKNHIKKISNLACSHLHAQSESQQNEEKQSNNILNFQFNCNFLDLKSDKEDTVLPNRTRKIQGVQKNEQELIVKQNNQQKQKLIKNHHEFIHVHNISLEQSILIKTPIINQTIHFEQKNLTYSRTPINELKFEESDIEELHQQYCQTGNPEVDGLNKYIKQKQEIIKKKLQINSPEKKKTCGNKKILCLKAVQH